METEQQHGIQALRRLDPVLRISHDNESNEFWGIFWALLKLYRLLWLHRHRISVGRNLDDRQKILAMDTHSALWQIKENRHD